jgi:hypothetical protein
MNMESEAKTKYDTYNHQPDYMRKIGSKGGKKGGLWKQTKDGRSRSEIYRKRRITLIPPSISKD